MNKALQYWKTIAWSVLMLILFLLPSNNLSRAPQFPGISELIHVLMFGVFTWIFLFERLGRLSIVKPTFKIYSAGVLLGILFGILIEFLQEITGLGRTAELMDLVYDAAGCFLGLGGILLKNNF